MSFRPAWVLVLGLLAATADAAPILIVDRITGKLQGATGVVVGGVTYDVSFVDGTCFELFTGCDALSDFEFQTLSAAASAAQALLDTVLLDTAQGSFDARPDLTEGCSAPSLCHALVPFGLTPGGFVTIQYAANAASTERDAVFPIGQATLTASHPR